MNQIRSVFAVTPFASQTAERLVLPWIQFVSVSSVSSSELRLTLHDGAIRSILALFHSQGTGSGPVQDYSTQTLVPPSDCLSSFHQVSAKPLQSYVRTQRKDVQQTRKEARWWSTSITRLSNSPHGLICKQHLYFFFAVQYSMSENSMIHFTFKCQTYTS